MKVCYRCKLPKVISEFYKDKQKKDGLSSSCKVCKNKYFSSERWKTKRKQYRQTGAHKLASRKHNLKRSYGLTLEQYDKMSEKQNHVCAICGGINISRHLAVDHNHKTGKVRGLLCNACNFRIGMVEDKNLMAKLYNYLGGY